MRHAYIEEEIVERGVHQRKSKDEAPVDPLARLEGASVASGNRQDNQACHGKADAGKKHLAASHVGCDAKGVETYFSFITNFFGWYC